MSLLTQSSLPTTDRTHRIPLNVSRRQKNHPLLADLFLLSTGYHAKAFGHRIDRVSEEVVSYLMMYCLDGRGYFCANGQNYVVQKGDVVFAFVDVAHAYGADSRNPWTIQWAHFDGRDVPNLLELGRISPEKSVISIGERLNIISAFSDILDVLQSGYSLHHLIKVSACLRQILSSVALLNMYSPAPESKGLNVERVINFMLDNLTTACNLDDFAELTNLSRSHFSRQFHEKTGYAPIDYFIRLKIQKACEFLETTDMKVGEISRYLGYDDPYYFSRSFKKIMSMSPKEYRATREIRIQIT